MADEEQDRTPIRVAEEVWQDADGKAVPFNDERGKVVLFGKGILIDPSLAARYGIGKDGKLATTIAPVQKNVSGELRKK